MSHLITELQDLPRESTFWEDLRLLGYMNGQFFFPGMDVKNTPLTFDLLRKRYSMRTNHSILSVSGGGMLPGDDDTANTETQSNTPCHQKVHLTIANGDSGQDTVRAHIKSVPVLDVIGMMKGTYVPTGMDACLPSRDLENTNTASKVSNPNNQGYVDCITGYAMSRLVDAGKCPGFSKMYGHFTSIAPALRVDITDDFYSIRNMAWFHRGMGERFQVETIRDSIVDGAKSGKKSHKITIGDDIFGFTEDMKDIAETPEVLCEEFKQNTEPPKTTHPGDDELVEVTVLPGIGAIKNLSDDAQSEPFEDDEEEMTDEEDASNENDSGSDNQASRPVSIGDESEDNDSEDNDSEDSESEDDESGYDTDESDETDDDGGRFYAIIPNMPIQSSIYENLEGPVDTLLDNPEITEEHWKSILYQVVFSLAVAQKEARFVHNDLHTNNIMWVSTEDEFLWYRVDGAVFRVPTYGRVIKIIDFGRSFVEHQGREFLSDAFDFKNDAGGQYNYPPYYHADQPVVAPNPSFDLPRLACSIVEGSCDPLDEPETDVQKMLYRWLMDNRGKNILWNRNGEDRFQGFGLYKHIAKYCDNAVPSKELTNDVFAVFKTAELPSRNTKVYEFVSPSEEEPILLKKKAVRS